MRNAQSVCLDAAKECCSKCKNNQDLSAIALLEEREHCVALLKQAATCCHRGQASMIQSYRKLKWHDTIFQKAQVRVFSPAHFQPLQTVAQKLKSI